MSDERTPFEKEIDDATAPARIVEVALPVVCFHGKSLGRCRYCDEAAQTEQETIRDGGRYW